MKDKWLQAKVQAETPWEPEVEWALLTFTERERESHRFILKYLISKYAETGDEMYNAAAENLCDILVRMSKGGKINE
jgi:hypothetical protein